MCICVAGEGVAGDSVCGGGRGRFWGMKRSHKFFKGTFYT